MTSTPSEQQQAEPQERPAVIVAKAGRYYRNTRYLMAALLVGMGLWFGYDGFKGWPEQNAKYDQLDKQRQAARARGDHAEDQRLLQEQNKYKKHTDTDILFQKVLCFALPPLGVFVLLRALHNSRGEYRLDGTMLHVPGHPPVPFENITELDKRLWDRKGIAYIHYDLGDGRQGKLRLDDFVYERTPTDEIYKRIEQYVSPPDAQTQEKAPS